MSPLPLALRDLAPEAEMEAFERLKPRLAELWSVIFPGDAEHYTSVVVPSMTLEEDLLRRLPGLSFYEERLLFFLTRLRNPKARLVYVTSQPVHPLVLDYYLQFLTDIPGSHARARLTLLCAHDSSPRPLTAKILERPRLLARIRAAIPDRSRAYLTVFEATPLERRLAVALDVPLNGIDPRLSHLGSKSGARRVFLEAGVPFPLGADGLRDEAQVIEALGELAARRPGLERAILKRDDGFAGEGNALVHLPRDRHPEALRAALRGLVSGRAGEPWEAYLERFARAGGVVEEYLDAPQRASPSVQVRVNPRGDVILMSSHDQILGGPAGQIFRGCRFPADEAYRQEVQAAALQVGRVLASKGVVSRLSVDFLALRGGPGQPWLLSANEINLRLGGTTHPFLALRFLTSGALDAGGQFRTTAGVAKFYRATDNLESESYRGLLPEDLIEILTLNGLHWDPAAETGVLFHLIGAVSEFGKLGLTAIANSPAEVEALYARTLAVLDREAAREF